MTDAPEKKKLPGSLSVDPRIDSWLSVDAGEIITLKTGKTEFGQGIKTVIAQIGADELDVVKLDIEGAEKEVFRAGFESWLPKTRLLIVELHDRMVPGCSKSLFDAVSKYDFDCETRWENLIFYNKQLG